MLFWDAVSHIDLCSVVASWLAGWCVYPVYHVSCRIGNTFRIKCLYCETSLLCCCECVCVYVCMCTTDAALDTEHFVCALHSFGGDSKIACTCMCTCMCTCSLEMSYIIFGCVTCIPVLRVYKRGTCTQRLQSTGVIWVIQYMCRMLRSRNVLWQVPAWITPMIKQACLTLW